MKFNLIFARQQAPAPPRPGCTDQDYFILLKFGHLIFYIAPSHNSTAPLASLCFWLPLTLSIISVASFANNHVSHQMACPWARAACPCLPSRPRQPRYTDNSSSSNRHNSPQHKVSHLLHAAIHSRAGNKPSWSFTSTEKDPTWSFSWLLNSVLNVKAHFQPGEGPSMGLLCNCENLADLRLQL